MRGQTDPPLRRGQAQLGGHGTAQPGVGLGARRPGAFVQAAQNYQIRLLQARFQGAPDMQAWMQPKGRTDHLSDHQIVQQAGVAARRHYRQASGGGQQIGDEAHGGFASITGPEMALAVPVRCQPFCEANMGRQ